MNSPSPDRHLTSYSKQLSSHSTELHIVAHCTSDATIGNKYSETTYTAQLLAELLLDQLGPDLNKIKHIKIASCNSGFSLDGECSFAERLRNILTCKPFKTDVSVTGYLGYIGEYGRGKHSYCCTSYPATSKTRLYRIDQCAITFHSDGTTTPAKINLIPDGYEDKQTTALTP